MSITKEKITTIFELSNLHPKNNEAEEMSEHLEKILNHVEDLNEINVDNVTPFFQHKFRELPLAEDNPDNSPLAANCVSTFSQREENFLVVNRFVSKGEEEE